MNSMLRCTYGLCRPTVVPFMARRTTVGAQIDTLSISRRYASYSANQGKIRPKKTAKTQVKREKKPVTEAFKKFNRLDKKPRMAFPQIRPASELLSEYLPNDATIRLAVGRIHMAYKKPLYKSELNKEINTILTIQDRKVQFMGDLRKVPEDQITSLQLPAWLKSGLVGLAKATPSTPVSAQ